MCVCVCVLARARFISGDSSVDTHLHTHLHTHPAHSGRDRRNACIIVAAGLVTGMS